MDNKTLLLAVAALVILAAIFGWRELSRTHLEEKKLQMEENIRLDAQKLKQEAEQKRLQAELDQQKAEEAKLQAEKEKQLLQETIKEKIQKKLADLRSQIETTQNITFEKRQEGQTWTRKLHDIQLVTKDSLLIYLYHSGQNNEQETEISFLVKNIEQLRLGKEETVNFVEISAIGGQKLFEVCEKKANSNTCVSLSKSNRFKIYADNPQSAVLLKEKFEALKVLATQPAEKLKSLLDKGEI